MPHRMSSAALALLLALAVGGPAAMAQSSDTAPDGSKLPTLPQEEIVPTPSVEDVKKAAEQIKSDPNATAEQKAAADALVAAAIAQGGGGGDPSGGTDDSGAAAGADGSGGAGALGALGALLGGAGAGTPTEPGATTPGAAAGTTAPTDAQSTTPGPPPYLIAGPSAAQQPISAVANLQGADVPLEPLRIGALIAVILAALLVAVVALLRSLGYRTPVVDPIPAPAHGPVGRFGERVRGTADDMRDFLRRSR